MSEQPTEDRTSDLRKALDGLRGKAIEAHRAEDGAYVLHLCVAALDLIRRRGEGDGEIGLTLADVRWCFFLTVFWEMGDHALMAVRRALAELPDRNEGTYASHDRSVLRLLLTGLSSPLLELDASPVLDAPMDWFAERSKDIEDLTAFELLVEFMWFRDRDGLRWLELGRTLRERAKPDSPLAERMQKLEQRLAAQSALFRKHESCELPAASSDPGDPRRLAPGWRHFNNCEWHELDEFIRKCTRDITVDHPLYLSLFHLVRESSFRRRGQDDQLLSLSRRSFALTRQPGLALKEIRWMRFYQKMVNLREAEQLGRRSTLAECLRIAMLNELSALRSWDLGLWHAAMRQQAHVFLEPTGADMDADDALAALKRGVLGLVSLENDSRFDRAIELLDTVPEEQRVALVKDLLAAPPVYSYRVHHLLAAMSDGIPETILTEVAQWCVELEMSPSETYGWRLTYLSFWHEVLPYTDQAPALIDILRPALLHVAGRPPAWRCASDTFVAALQYGQQGTAEALAEALMAGDGVDAKDAERRYGILFDGCARRRELMGLCWGWLTTSHDGSPHAEHMLAHLEKGTSAGEAFDDEAFRSWLRNRTFELARRSDKVTDARLHVGGGLNPGLFSWVTWPDPEEQLIEDLMSAVDSPNPDHALRINQLDVLAQLVEHGHLDNAQIIADRVADWLTEGRIEVRDDPRSLFWLLGYRERHVTAKLLTLAHALLLRRPDLMRAHLTRWVIERASSQPKETMDAAFRIAVRLALSSDGDDTSIPMALIGLSDAFATRAEDDAPVVWSLGELFRAQGEDESVIAGAADTSMCRLLLALWRPRLLELAASPKVEVRRAVASALKQWRIEAATNDAIDFDEDLGKALTHLTQDPRGRVRAAAKG